MEMMVYNQSLFCTFVANNHPHEKDIRNSVD
jgi:hypothetical protein